MLFFVFISCFSFIFLYNSIYLKPLPHWTSEMRLVSPFFLKDLSIATIIRFIRTGFYSLPLKMSFKNKSFSSKVVKFDDSSNISSSGSCSNSEMSLLDLPELVLECILERLPPEGLGGMASVCSSMRERCMSDHLWEKHLKQKWGEVIGPAAYREWQYHILYNKESSFFNQPEQKGLMNYLAKLWPVSLIRSNCNNDRSSCLKMKHSLPIDSIMSWYLALESGKFWFPAQVYNRENGHVGFLLSCYDAELCYDPKTDTFQARYPPHGRRAVAIETGVTWDRVRSAPIDTSPYDLHTSNSLNELRPGDHIEIQWRRNKEFPYGWWYGIVGHLELCDGDENYCRCPESDMVALEFNQYAPGSRWRRTIINKKDHKEEGNEGDGFYAGIRKLYGDGEIRTWNHLWPAAVLE
ncbi:hypothetical protein LIER_03763 [Lithospermum erythrorhizon]|uniref:F-box domain-containing protein n=1 Tax=Lithospermum erythrorhizon TaxID=34254 RepID=A0AAV3NVT3_LITER